MQGDYFILCTKASCQHFSPPRRNFFHHKSYSFLSRTVRLTNSNPKALLLGCRGTLAQNRGTMGVQIPFSFPKSLDFKPLQTKVRILPWQMNKIFVIAAVSFLKVKPSHSLADFQTDFKPVANGSAGRVRLFRRASHRTQSVFHRAAHEVCFTAPIAFFRSVVLWTREGASAVLWFSIFYAAHEVCLTAGTECLSSRQSFNPF